MSVKEHGSKHNEKSEDKHKNGHPMGNVEEILEVTEGSFEFVVKRVNKGRVAGRERTNKRVRALRKKRSKGGGAMPVRAGSDESNAHHNETDARIMMMHFCN